MSAIRVVVADTTRARVFAATARKGELTEAFDLVNPEARLHERDLSSDLTGRGANSTAGTSSSYGIDNKRKSQSIRSFAQQLAERLTHDRSVGVFDKLYILAEPSFLGELRAALDDATRSTIAAAVDKNLTRASLEHIRAALPDYL